MKRIIAAILAILCIAAVLTACSGGSETTKPLSEIYSTLKTEAATDDLMDIDSIALLERYYGITDDYCEEFAGGLSTSGVKIEEIVLTKARDEAGAEYIMTAFQNRLDALYNQYKNYDPEQAAVIERCKVRRNGLYVALIISPNGEIMGATYEKDVK